MKIYEVSLESLNYTGQNIKNRHVKAANFEVAYNKAFKLKDEINEKEFDNDGKIIITKVEELFPIDK